jgi:ribosome maturation factor RimP
VPVDGRTLEGRVVGADDEGVDLETAGSVRRYGYAELGRGRVQVEFDRSADPGSETPDGREGS